MREILPGVFHWTTFHEGIRQPVSSYYVGPEDGGATAIDPRVPEEGLDWFRESGAPERILLTNRHHYRHSGRFVEAFGCSVLCERSGLYEFEEGPPVEPYEFGREVAPGITALEVGAICSEDAALHVRAGHGALAFADALVHYGDRVGFVPDSYLGEDPEGVKRGVRVAVRRLLEQEFDTLLFAHGDPVVGGGRKALEAFLELDSE